MLNERFEITTKVKNYIYSFIGIGLVLIIVGLFLGKIPQEMDGTTVNVFAWNRFWANFLLSAFYFTAISVVAGAFICIQYLANGGWYIVFKRILESMSMFLPIGFAAFVIIILATFLGEHHGMNAIYEWMHKDVVQNDEVLKGKSGYLNQVFFIVRLCLYFGMWIFFTKKLRRQSIQEDSTRAITWYNKSMGTAATFLPIFGLSFCFATWDWIMSIQPHWYSTIFGVNVFAAALVGAMAITNITAILLKKGGYMSYVNENHFHDTSKFIFGFTIFWTYTWLSQFLLIWYANLPEEIPFYLTRLRGPWRALFFGNLFMNFIFPFFLYMTRDAKRRMGSVLFVAIVVLVGKWIDWYLIIMPESAGESSGFGLLEIGFFMLFGGLFAYVVANQLTKANLVPNNHPFLEESLHHEI